MLVGHQDVADSVADGEEDCGDEHDAGHVDDLGFELGVRWPTARGMRFGAKK